MLYVLYDIIDIYYDITVMDHWLSLTVYISYDITYDAIQGETFLGQGLRPSFRFCLPKLALFTVLRCWEWS
jgi:hypothetical protein